MAGVLAGRGKERAWIAPIDCDSRRCLDMSYAGFRDMLNTFAGRHHLGFGPDGRRWEGSSAFQASAPGSSADHTAEGGIPGVKTHHQRRPTA